MLLTSCISIFLWHGNALVIFRLNILRCQLQIIQQWLCTTVPFLLVIDYIRYTGSFDILQAKVKCHLSVGPARPVPRALNKRLASRVVDRLMIFHVYYLGLLGEHLDQVS